MRKLSVLAAAVLSLAAASSVFAVTPPPPPAPPTAPVMAPSHWTATFKADGLSGRAALFANGEYTSGWLKVQVRGSVRGAKLEATVVDTTTQTTLIDVTSMVRSHHGVRGFLSHLDAKELAALKAAVAAKDTLTITITSGTSTATGTFAVGSAFGWPRV